MASPPTTKPELKAYLITTLPTAVPEIVEMRWVDSCDGDEGCGGLLLVRVNVDLTDDVGRRLIDEAIGEHVPEALADDSLPHFFVLGADEDWDDYELPHPAAPFETVYTVKKETL